MASLYISSARGEGGWGSRVLVGVDMSSNMQRALWTNPKTAWRYMPLAQVLFVGSSGYSST